MKKEKSNKYYDMPIIELLQKVKNGVIDPTSFAKETRQACVEVLFGEGHSTQSSAASLLQTTDRTIRRDLEEIRKRNCLYPSADLTRQLVGEMVSVSRTTFARLKQIARSDKASLRAMSDAEFLAWTVTKEMFMNLNLIGFLKGGTDVPKPSWSENPKMSPENEAIRREYENMTPMQREMLVERLRKDILRLEKEEKPKTDPDDPEQAAPISK